MYFVSICSFDYLISWLFGALRIVTCECSELLSRRRVLFLSLVVPLCLGKFVAHFGPLSVFFSPQLVFVTGHSHCLGGSTSAGSGGAEASLAAGTAGAATSTTSGVDQQQRLSQLRHPRQPATTGSCASNRYGKEMKTRRKTTKKEEGPGY